MDDLITFLRDRLAEDEHIAHEASSGGEGEWHWDSERGYEVGSYTSGDAIPFVVCREDRPGVGADEQLAHIARHDPARVLREVEAKQLLMKDHRRNEVGRYTRKPFCDCQEMDGVVVDAWPCDTLKFLALPYSDHPEYQESWRP